MKPTDSMQLKLLESGPEDLRVMREYCSVKRESKSSKTSVHLRYSALKISAILNRVWHVCLSGSTSTTSPLNKNKKLNFISWLCWDAPFRGFMLGCIKIYQWTYIVGAFSILCRYNLIKYYKSLLKWINIFFHSLCLDAISYSKHI